MNKIIMRPAIKLMGVLSYKIKFMLIFMLFLLPMVVLSLILLKAVSEKTAMTIQEKAGIEYLQVLNSILKETTNHRGMAVALLHGNASFRERISAKNAVIDQMFVTLAELDKKSRINLDTGSRGDDLLKNWNILKQVNATSTEEIVEAHKKLTVELNECIRHISITSQLVLDPDLGAYLLATISFNRLPTLTASVARLRRISSEVALKKMLTPEDSIRISSNKEVVLENLNSLEFELKTAYRDNSDFRTQLDGISTAAITAARNYMQYLDLQLGSKSVATETEQFFNEGTATLEKIWALDTAINQTLNALFEERLVRQHLQERAAYSVTILTLLLIAYLFIGFYLAVNQAVVSVAEGTWALAAGNLCTRIELEVKDEMASIATNFNAMATVLEERAASDEREKLAEARKIKDLRERLSILSAHIEQVASGDLSHRLEIVGDDDLARLGCNLNAMTESLAVLTSRTTEGINTIYSALDELQQSIAGQSAGASEQAAAVNEITASLDQIKQMAAQTMEKVKFLGETAERSRFESEQGNAAVEQAMADMTALLNRMNGIAQTILALSEQTQQIGEITGVVSNLAQQSKMLALNASIEAAKAGEAGKGFAVVAAEVRELAEQSQQSTAQVQKILQDIRHATDRAVMATEQGSKGVDAGMISVQRSGIVMKQLGEVVRETAMVSQQISAVAKQQFIGLEQVTTAMKDINKVTTQFVVSTQQSKASTVGISHVADGLRDSVSVYKL